MRKAHSVIRIILITKLILLLTACNKKDITKVIPKFSSPVYPAIQLEGKEYDLFVGEYQWHNGKVSETSPVDEADYPEAFVCLEPEEWANAGEWLAQITIANLELLLQMSSEKRDLYLRQLKKKLPQFFDERLAPENF